MNGQVEHNRGQAAIGDRRRASGGFSPREAVPAALLFVAIAGAVYSQLFDYGEVLASGKTASAVRLAIAAGVALFLALLLEPRVLLRSLLALPILALALLTALTFLVPVWASTEAVQVTRLGLLALGYTGLAASAFVLARRFGPLPVLVLVAVTATVAGAMGLWGYVRVDNTLAGLNQGDFVPFGPLSYRNTLALLCASALIPLGRWAIPGSRNATSALISIASGAALGISAVVVGVALSEFAIAFALLLAFAVLIWPGPSLGVRVDKTLAPLLAAGGIAIAAWILFRKVLPLPPDPSTVRLTVMLCLVGLTPALIWGLYLITGRLSETNARRVSFSLFAVGAFAVLLAAIGPGLSTGSADVRIRYYEVVIETLNEEPLIGVGPGNYPRASFLAQTSLLPGTNTKFAHTIPGENWIELGLGGLLATLLLYFAAFRDAWRTRWVPEAALLAPLVLGFLLSGLIDWSWHIPAMTALWAAALGTVAGVALAGSEPRPEPDASPERTGRVFPSE